MMIIFLNWAPISLENAPMIGVIIFISRKLIIEF